MRRLALVGLGAVLLGFFVPLTSAGAAAPPATYALGAAKSCKANYVEKIASHKVKGKTVKYIACVYKAPKAPAKPSATTTTAPANTSTGSVGSTLNAKDENNNVLAVTLTQIVDPAQGTDEFDQPDAGNRFIAVEMTLTNKSTATISDDANSDVTVVGTDNQDYTPDFDDVTECTNFSDGQFTVLPGGSQNGCVVFQLPTGVSAKEVQFSFASGFTNTVQWNV